MSAAMSATPPVRPVGRRCRPGRRVARAARSICPTPINFSSTARAAISGFPGRLRLHVAVALARRRRGRRFVSELCRRQSTIVLGARSARRIISSGSSFPATLRGRVGLCAMEPRWLFYATGGFAWSYDQFTRTKIAGIPAGGTAVPGTVENLFLKPRVGGVGRRRRRGCVTVALDRAARISVHRLRQAAASRSRPARSASIPT